MSPTSPRAGERSRHRTMYIAKMCMVQVSKKVSTRIIYADKFELLAHAIYPYLSLVADVHSAHCKQLFIHHFHISYNVTHTRYQDCSPKSDIVNSDSRIKILFSFLGDMLV